MISVECNTKEWRDFATRLGSSQLLDTNLKRVARDISKALLKRIKGYTPAQDYDLINAWDKNKFLVTETTDGYEVLLINEIDYAIYVNDGHKQRPGRFIPGRWVSHSRFQYIPNHPEGMRLKQSFVKGRFFVEKGIISIVGTSEINNIILRELQKWWDSV